MFILRCSITTKYCRYPMTRVPLLLCLGKGLVVILNYIQTAGPLRSGVLFSQQRSGPFHSWERSGDTTCPRRGRNSCPSSRGSGPPKETGPPRGPGPLTKGRNRHPTSGWSGDATYLQDMAVWVSIQTFTHHCIHCGSGAAGAAHAASASLP